MDKLKKQLGPKGHAGNLAHCQACKTDLRVHQTPKQMPASEECNVTYATKVEEQTPDTHSSTRLGKGGVTVSLCHSTDDSGYGCSKVTACVPSHPADRQQ